MRDPRAATSAPRAAAVLVVAGLLGGCGAASVEESRPPSTAPAPTPGATTTLEPASRAHPSAVTSPAATPVPSDGSTAGEERTDAFGVRQVWVPAGTFTM